jgi:hypothetical protein
MTTTTPATDRLAAKLKAARSISLYAIDITPQHAQEIIDENRRLTASNPLDAMTPQDCALGQHPAWAVDGEKSLPCPWCALEQAEAERDQAREIARRAYRNWMTPRLRELAEGDPAFSANAASLLGLDALPPWLTQHGDAVTAYEPRETAGSPR